jgi:hypothetical protein
MKFIRSFLLLALLGSTSVGRAATSSTSPVPSVNLSVAGTADELIALERLKVDYLFGTPEQKQAVLPMFAEDFGGISVGPAGPQWGDHSGVVGNLKIFPNLPAGAFTLVDFHVTTLAAGSIVVTYKITGPGPTGATWTAINSSIWVKRGHEWKTVFYQATPISGS